jgi:hypothetical protein
MREEIWRPSARAFLVYYVAFALAVLGPLINPEMGVPPWLGFILGLLVAAAVFYLKYGQEYRATPRGLKRVGFWPAQEEEIVWPQVGEIKVQRGLTQTLLNAGNLVILDRTGTPRLCWERLADPKGVKAALEARLVAEGARSGQEGGGD